jgi:hypothetical protein
LAAPSPVEERQLLFLDYRTIIEEGDALRKDGSISLVAWGCVLLDRVPLLEVLNPIIEQPTVNHWGAHWTICLVHGAIGPLTVRIVIYF